MEDLSNHSDKGADAWVTELKLRTENEGDSGRSRRLGIWRHWEIPSAGKLIWIRVLGGNQVEDRKRKREKLNELQKVIVNIGLAATAIMPNSGVAQLSLKRKFVKKIGKSERRSQKKSNKPY